MTPPLVTELKFSVARTHIFAILAEDKRMMRNHHVREHEGRGWIVGNLGYILKALLDSTAMQIIGREEAPLTVNAQ